MTARGFDTGEYRARLAKAQAAMAGSNLDGLLLTTEPEVRYFTGFLTRFWESPTRPWFLLVPADGMPVAVIPSIGAALMAGTWVEDIRTWSSPDLEDDGIGLLAATMGELFGRGARVGTPTGHETHLRMPIDAFRSLEAAIAPSLVCPDDGIIRRLRMVKSDAEVAKIETACAVAGRAFGRVGEVASEGVAMEEVFRGFQRLCLEEGADWVPYLAGGKGPMGYGDVISPADPSPLRAGEALMLDTGLVHDGYFCDYDRNYAVGNAGPETRDGWKTLLEAAAAGADAARPGATAAGLFRAMDGVLTGGKGGGTAGRLGHGLGMQLTEWPSLVPGDETMLEPGMVITLEPSLEMPDGSVLVHEDNFLVTNGGLRQLSPAAPEELWTL